MKTSRWGFGRSQHLRLVIATIIWLCLATVLLATSFQRMRIPGGTQVVRSGGGHISAICVDPDLDTPMPWNSYSYGSPEITVTRSEDGKSSPPQTLEYALQNWINIEGTGQYVDVRVQPKPGFEHSEFRFDVATSGGLIAETSLDGEGYWADLKARSEVLGKADRFLADAEDVLGQENLFLQELRRRRWDILEANLDQTPADGIPGLVEKTLQRLREVLAPEKLSEKQRLIHIALVAGEKPSGEQLAKLMKLTGRQIAAEFPENFASTWKEFSEKQASLQSVFSEDTAMIWEFRERADLRLSDSEYSEPDDFRDSFAEFNDRMAVAWALEHGKPLTIEQLGVLRGLGAQIHNEPSQELADAIQRNEGNKALLRKAFGRSGQLTMAYEKRVLSTFEMGSLNVKSAIEAAASGILPPPLLLIRGQPGCDRLLQLRLGQDLNAEALEVLERVCGWKKGPPGPPSPPIVFLGEDPDPGADGIRFLMHTEDRTKIPPRYSSRVVAAGDLSKAFKESAADGNGVDHSHIVFSGEILSSSLEKMSQEGSGKTAKIMLDWLKYQIRPPPRHLADILHRAGVKVVTEFGRYARDLANPPVNVKFLCVLSEDETVASQLFGGQAVAPVARAAARIKALAKEFPDRVGLVETKKALSDEIERLRVAGIRPIVVYHGRDFIYFGGSPMRIADLGGDFDRISCETFRVQGLEARTTSFIDIEHIAYILEDALRISESGKPTFFAGLWFGPKDSAEVSGKKLNVDSGGRQPPGGGPPGGGGNGMGGGGDGNGRGGDDPFHTACEKELGQGVLFCIGNTFYYVSIFHSRDDNHEEPSSDLEQSFRINDNQ
jgi:hypothetical protein